MSTSTVRLRGFRELNRAFKVADRTLHKELQSELREAAEPVRSGSEELARGGIPRIGNEWWQMRVGVTTKVVYVAPKKRSKDPRRKRPNLAGLLLGRSMEPALEANASVVEAHVGRALDTVGRVWEAV